jgi:hypothetical protein
MIRPPQVPCPVNEVNVKIFIPELAAVQRWRETLTCNGRRERMRGSDLSLQRSSDLTPSYMPPKLFLQVVSLLKFSDWSCQTPLSQAKPQPLFHASRVVIVKYSARDVSDPVHRFTISLLWVDADDDSSLISN